ncbi:SDR family oxidoreductase [Micromonospora parva]|uniref:SDR family oxidoreductase n=1 Tax=Micromonospora parva TaxID=1464048 RepID=UPI0037945C2A
MIERGRVVHISSAVAAMGFHRLSAHRVTTPGREVFTRSLAHDVGRRGLTSNAVAPNRPAPSRGTRLERVNAATSTGCVGDIDEMAATVAYPLPQAAVDPSGG